MMHNSSNSAINAVNAGCRAHFRQKRSAQIVGRTVMVWPPRYARRSSAKAAAVAYRCEGSFFRQCMQIVSRSRGVCATVFRMRSGSRSITIFIVCMTVSPRNGGLPVSNS